MRIDYDDHLEDVVKKMNEALKPLNLSFVDDGNEHDGFIEYRLVHTTATVSPDATIEVVKVNP